MNILSLLQEILGAFHQQKDEYLFNCPFCHHSKKKLSINILTNKWKCWVCHAKGGHIIWLLRKLNLSKDQMVKAKELLGDVEIKKYKSTEDVKVTLRLPPEYTPSPPGFPTSCGQGQRSWSSPVWLKLKPADWGIRAPYECACGAVKCFTDI